MEVTVLRSRRKTLVLTVNRYGEVILRAPLGVKESELDRFINEHRVWIDARLAEQKKNGLNLEDGAELVLFGERVVLASGKRSSEDGILRLPREEREKAFREYLKKLASIRMSETVRALAQEYGFIYKSVRISSARGRWGSCGANGTITFSFRVAFLPSDISRAVAVHELCHTRFFNHGKAFWQEVEKSFPIMQPCVKF